MRDDRNTSLKCDMDETAPSRVYCIKLHVRAIKSEEDMEPQKAAAAYLKLSSRILLHQLRKAFKSSIKMADLPWRVAGIRNETRFSTPYFARGFMSVCEASKRTLRQPCSGGVFMTTELHLPSAA
jgi:hypothetical protein